MDAKSDGLTGGIGDDLALRIQQSSSSRSSPAVYTTASSALVISFKVLVGVPLRERICLHVEADVVGLFGHLQEVYGWAQRSRSKTLLDADDTLRDDYMTIQVLRTTRTRRLITSFIQGSKRLAPLPRSVVAGSLSSMVWYTPRCRH
jgi:hypothetical protein